MYLQKQGSKIGIKSIKLPYFYAFNLTSYLDFFISSSSINGLCFPNAITQQNSYIRKSKFYRHVIYPCMYACHNMYIHVYIYAYIFCVYIKLCEYMDTILGYIYIYKCASLSCILILITYLYASIWYI